MDTHEIPIDQWLPYFNDLGRRYNGWATSMAAGDVLIEVGDIGTPYETHRVREPSILRVADTQPGAETDLEIESRDGTTTLVRIRRRQELPDPRQDRPRS
jgi:hypothetical protein